MSSENPYEHMQGGNYKKLYGRHNTNYYQIKATWVRDHSKSVLVDIDENETVNFLLRTIGERMEETHDDFRGLRHCQATYIFLQENDGMKTSRSTHHKEDTKRYALNNTSISKMDFSSSSYSPMHNPAGASTIMDSYLQHDKLDQPHVKDKIIKGERLIKNCLKSGDRIFFEIDSIDLWLHTSITLNLGNKKILDGKAEFKFNKSASISKLRKKLQMFAIKLWCHKNTSPPNINGEDDSFSADN